MYMFVLDVETQLSDLDLLCFMLDKQCQKSLVAISPVMLEPQTDTYLAYQLLIFSKNADVELTLGKSAPLNVLSHLRQLVENYKPENFRTTKSLLEFQKEICFANYQIPGNSNPRKDSLNKSLMIYWLNVFRYTKGRISSEAANTSLVEDAIDFMIFKLFKYDDVLGRATKALLQANANDSLIVDDILNIPLDRETHAYIEIQRKVMEHNNLDRTTMFYKHVARLLYAPKQCNEKAILMCSRGTMIDQHPAGVGKTTFLEIIQLASRGRSLRLDTHEITDLKMLNTIPQLGASITLVDDMTFEMLFGKGKVQDLIKKLLEGAAPYTGMRMVMTSNVALCADYIAGAKEYNLRVIKSICKHRQTADPHIPAIIRRFQVYNFQKMVASESEMELIEDMKSMPFRRLLFAGFLKRLYLSSSDASVAYEKQEYRPERPLKAGLDLAKGEIASATCIEEDESFSGLDPAEKPLERCFKQLSAITSEIKALVTKVSDVHESLSRVRSEMNLAKHARKRYTSRASTSATASTLPVLHGTKEPTKDYAAMAPLEHIDDDCQPPSTKLAKASADMSPGGATDFGTLFAQYDWN